MRVEQAGPVTGAAVLRRALVRHRGRLGAATALMSLHQAMEALVPVVIGLTIDRAVATGSVAALGWCLLLLAGLFAVLAAGYLVGARLLVRALLEETHLLRVEVADRVVDPRGLAGPRSSGELLAIGTSDTEGAALVVESTAVGVAGLTGVLVTGAALVAVDPLLGVGVLVGVPLLAALVQLSAPLVSRRTAARQEALGATSALAGDLVSGARALRGVGAQGAAARRYRATSATALRASVRAASAVGVHRGATELGSGVVLAAVALVAGSWAVDGRITVGELVTVVGLAVFLAEPVRTLSRLGQVVAASAASAARVAEVLAAPVRHAAGTAAAAEPARGALELSGVHHRGLRGLDLAVAPGELLAVVAGEPGEAEALTAVLAGTVAADERGGTVRVDGVDTDTLTPDAARRAVLVQPHHVVLLEGTLRSNLDVHADRDDAALHAAARASAAGDVLERGLDLPVGDGGLDLSGGERQRLALARSLLADPAVLVLHDPTTAVDAVTEAAVADGLRAVRHGAGTARTTVVLTASPALLERADRVVVVRDGRAGASGTHAELLADDAAYRAAVTR